jgi:HK97 family phage portal protein
MGWLATALSQKSGSTVDLIREVFGGRISGSGKAVTTKTALQVATVFAVCRVIGEGLAQVPLKLMRESADGKTRLPAKDNPLYYLMGRKPNDYMTSFEYREMIGYHCVLTGAHFSFISRGTRGRILELIPFTPGRVTVKRASDWTLSYEVIGDDGSIQTFPAEAIWHVKGPSWDGWQGLEVVQLAREAVGLSLALEASSASLHKRGVQASGVYSVEGTLSPDQYKALKTWIDNNLAGSDNAGGTMLMDRSAKWMQTTMTSVDAQTIESRKFQIGEICRFARVNPIMVYGDDKLATYAGSSANFLSHMVHTMSPWYERLEQSMDAYLLTEKERADGQYFNFVEEGMLRANPMDTKDILLGYVNGGIMTPNEGRAALDLNPMDDEDSDELRIPANIVGELPEEPEEETGDNDEEQPQSGI